MNPDYFSVCCDEFGKKLNFEMILTIVTGQRKHPIHYEIAWQFPG